MEDPEHNATPVIFQFVDVRSSMSMRDGLTGGIEPPGFCASRQVWRQGAKVAAED
jgi:hypothetical protein